MTTERGQTNDSLVQLHNALMWRCNHRTRLETDRKGDPLAESHSVLEVWKNVHRVNGVRQTETHTAESAVSEPRAFEVQMANG
jgi:hypothetical protein